MKQRTTSQACCIIFSIATAIAPVVHAAGEGNLQMARAIGQDTAPPATAPKDKEAPPKQPGTDAAKTPEVAPESQPLSSGARIGLIIAGVLVLAGGGGGGGGGGGETPIPPTP